MKTKLNREQRMAGPLSKKKKFTKEEDSLLISLVDKYSTDNWKIIANHLPPRTARQCRERWNNYINPDLNLKPWTKEEDNVLILSHQLIGNNWKKLAELLPKRSKNNIKSRFNLLNSMINDKSIMDLIDDHQSISNNLSFENENSFVPSQYIQTVTISQPVLFQVSPIPVTYYYYQPQYDTEIIEPLNDNLSYLK